MGTGFDVLVRLVNSWWKNHYLQGSQTFHFMGLFWPPPPQSPPPPIKISPLYNLVVWRLFVVCQSFHIQKKFGHLQQEEEDNKSVPQVSRQTTREGWGVCQLHRGLAIYIKKYLKAKEECWKLKYNFTMQKL